MGNAEQIFSTLIGATIGFVIGGPAGALLGGQIGMVAPANVEMSPLPVETMPRASEST